MKRIALLIIILSGLVNLFSQQPPVVEFQLKDGSFKKFNISDIDNFSFIKSKSIYQMEIFYQTSKVSYFPVEVISKLQFDNDSKNNKVLNVYVIGYPQSYIISKVDSIYFFIDFYQSITIGTQHWMLKNLDVSTYSNGDSIPQVIDPVQWANLTTGAWCYYGNNSDSGKTYGKLYNWYAVNDSRGLAPKEWHISKDEEWSILRTYLSGNKVAGGKLKESETSHWQSPNLGATNESGFTALPGGFRYDDGSYDRIGFGGIWWTSTEGNDALPFYCYLGYDYVSVNRTSYYSKKTGFSVRCVKY
ncbi:MAG: hypothetical protein HW421_1958 [Ignavibacteria bacterium]|nr:hypothetical protein [Ignavibacteria bacterium]